MNDSLLKAIMYLLVGVTVLLVGMKFMSGGLKKIAGRGLRQFFKKTQNNPFLGMGMGIAVTAVIQSSDATAALVIGFINASVMTMFQGISIILGAYIGTTITGIIASFSSLPISIYLLSLAFIGMVLMFFSNDKVKNVGEILCGLGLIFFGLAVMKDAFSNSDIRAFCVSMFSSINFPILLFAIGIVLAALAQSSSAVTGIVIAMVGGGALELGPALFIVLGATVGTVTNTLLASLNGTVEGKRTAWIMFSMRTITALIALVIVWILQGYIVPFLRLMQINGSDEFPLAMFTVIYNVIFMPLLIPFIKPFIRLFENVIKDKSQAKFAGTVKFIDDNLLKSPDVASMQVRKEIIHMFDLAYKNYKLGVGKILAYNNETGKEIALIEGQVDYLNQRITDFLIKLAPLREGQGEVRVGAFFHVVNDIERIGDHAYNFSTTADEMHNEDLSFSPAAQIELKEMDAILRQMFELSRNTFQNKNPSSLHVLKNLEEKTHELKQNFYQHHYDRIIKEECSPKMTPYLSTIIVELERVADHLANIGYSIISPTGSSHNDLNYKKPRLGRRAKGN